MERNLISINLPNIITIPLMAGLGFLVLGLGWQLIKNFTGAGGGPSAMSPSGSASVAVNPDDGSGY